MKRRRGRSLFKRRWMKGRTQRHLNWTSRGRWRVGVDFVKLSKKINPINQPIRIPDGSLPLPASVGEFSHQKTFFFQLTGEKFFTFISWFCGGDAPECSRPFELQRSENSSSSSVMKLDCFLCIFWLEILKYCVKLLFLGTHSAPFFKKRKENEPLKNMKLNRGQKQDEGGMMLKEEMMMMVMKMKSGCVWTQSSLVQ